WIIYLRPAVVAFLIGQDPYFGNWFVNPPWLLVLLAPFGLLPPFWGAVGIDLVSVSGLVALCRKSGKIWMALPLVLSFPSLVLLWSANVDGLSLWGLALGGPVGLLLLSTKPQVAGLVGVVWTAQAWREGGWRKAAILVAPTLVVALVFLVIYPHWPSVVFAPTQRTGQSDATGFPWFMPLGLALLAAAVRRNREEWAALASMMVASYARPQSWIGAMTLLAVRYPPEGIIAVAASWLIPFLILGKL
ncbi:MAG: hypothetical protein HY784_08615, partial [Chloroflexi bacterium]|nr:hypothetical protein [Chloroflexota bacterium]